MAETYYLDTVASDLSASGSNFDNAMPRTAPGTTTLAITVTTNTTETDYGFTPSGDPGADGGTGSQNYTVTVEINSGNADLQCDVQIHRINSSGTPQNSSGFNGEQTANTGTLTYTFSSVDLGTFASGDRVRVDLQMRDTTIHGNENLTYDIGTAGVRLAAPWTIGGGGPAAGLRTLALTGAGI